MTAMQAAIIIKESETSRELHKKHKRFLKPETNGAIKNLYVPYPRSEWAPKEKDITEEKCQMKVMTQFRHKLE